MHKTSRVRDGSLVVTAVLLTAALGLSGMMASRTMERDLARLLRSASDGHELEPILEAAIEEAHYRLVIGAAPGAPAMSRSEHDPIAFLRDETKAVAFPVSEAAGAIEPGCGIELAPVEAQVVDRTVGGWEKVGAGAVDADAVPTLFTSLRTTWGVVELRASARWPRGRGPTATRHLYVRRLFTVVDHVWDTGEAKSYAHVFANSIARVMEAE